MIIFKNEDHTPHITLAELCEECRKYNEESEYNYAMENPIDFADGDDGIFDKDSALDSFLDDYDDYPDLAFEKVKENVEVYDVLIKASEQGDSDGYNKAETDFTNYLRKNISDDKAKELGFDSKSEFIDNFTDMDEDELNDLCDEIDNNSEPQD